MDAFKWVLIFAGIVLATFFVGLFWYVFYRLFPILLPIQDIFISIFSALKYHTASMVTFGTALFWYLVLKTVLFVKSFIS